MENSKCTDIRTNRRNAGFRYLYLGPRSSTSNNIKTHIFFDVSRRNCCRTKRFLAGDASAEKTQTKNEDKLCSTRTSASSDRKSKRASISFLRTFAGSSSVDVPHVCSSGERLRVQNFFDKNRWLEHDPENPMVRAQNVRNDRDERGDDGGGRDVVSGGVQIVPGKDRLAASYISPRTATDSATNFRHACNDESYLEEVGNAILEKKPLFKRHDAYFPPHNSSQRVGLYGRPRGRRINDFRSRWLTKLLETGYGADEEGYSGGRRKSVSIDVVENTATKVVENRQKRWRGRPYGVPPPRPIKRKITRNEINFDLPLYTPSTKKMSWEQVEHLIRPENREEIKRWLTSEEHYRILMRGTPMKLRRGFQNVTKQEDVNKIVAAGIMSVADTKVKSAAFVKLTSVNETKKSRRRLILETRCINRAIRKNKEKWMPKMNLPSHRRILEAAQSASSIESLDFKSFFYQIELHPSVRKYFRLWVNGVLYELNVLPMGACFCPGIAQTIAEGALEFLRNEDDVAAFAYVDNLFYFTNNPKRSRVLDREKIPEIGTHEKGPCLEILGRLVDLSNRTIDITKRMREKLAKAVLEMGNVQRWSTREYFQAWGRVLFATGVLHQPLSVFYSELRSLATICRNFLSGELELEDDPRRYQAGLLEGVKNMTVLVLSLGPSIIPRVDEKEECFVYSDASKYFGAYVLQLAGKWEIKSWRNPIVKGEVVHINVAEAIAGVYGVERAALCLHGNQLETPKVTWFTDSKVVFFGVEKGHSKNELINECISRIQEARVFVCPVWIPSDENIADGPSRGNNDVVKECKHELGSVPVWFGAEWRSGGV
jgi:ribosomal protein L19E